MQFLHAGDYSTINFMHRDERGDARWVTVMRATYDIAADGGLSFTSPQPAVNFREQAYGDIVDSPPKLESELAPKKVKTDVVILANAHAPGGQPSARFDVGLFIREKDAGPGRQGRLLHERRLRVTGPREWRYRGALARSVGADEWALSEPEPTREVPLRYDYAYGGTVRLDDATQRPQAPPMILAHDANPVGRGYLPRVAELKSELALDTARATALRSEWSKRRASFPAPQIELPGRPLASVGDDYPLLGWGFIAKHWASRYRYAGTYDERWRATRYPTLPVDFDPRYWNGAHPDMQLDELPVDCVIETANLLPVERAPSQSVRVALPGLAPLCHVFDSESGQTTSALMALDTVVLDLLQHQLILLYRHSVPDSRSLAYVHLDSAAAA
jgi:hypothetical protein